ncbi:MAG: ribonuclease HI [Deltaproteobacteria bacterium]|nr:ribonuclease HI [Deltaproteobacteria bacterium]
MPWLRHRLRDADVWARVDGSGALIKDAEGRVEIVYKAETGGKVYRAGARNLTPLPGDPVEIEVGAAAPPSGPKSAATPANAIHVWTDGACSGNPGPAGIGVVIVDGDRTQELSEYLGEGTNNIAELTAILRGLETVPPDQRDRPVAVYSDSQYSIGLLSQNWKAKANVELVTKLRALTKQFKDLRFVKVLGHSGIPLNERTDQLATAAVSRRR